MRVVDEETRREVRDARLEALEADNYVEHQDDAGDDAYVDSEVGDWRKERRGSLGMDLVCACVRARNWTVWSR